MGDLAERAGISRATLYRDAGLRDLVGARGDGPARRPIDQRHLRSLERQVAELTELRASLRKELREARREIRDLRERVARLVDENEDRRQSQRFAEANAADEEKMRNEAYAAGFAAGTRSSAQRAGVGRGAGASGLTIAAARLPKASVLAARRTLARALHPDLFATDPAAALLATELLKQLNGLAER